MGRVGIWLFAARVAHCVTFQARRAPLMSQRLLCHDSTWRPHGDNARGEVFSLFDVLEKNLRFLPVQPHPQFRNAITAVSVDSVPVSGYGLSYGTVVTTAPWTIARGTTILANGTTLSLRLVIFCGKPDSCGIFLHFRRFLRGLGYLGDCLHHSLLAPSYQLFGICVSYLEEFETA